MRVTPELAVQFITDYRNGNSIRMVAAKHDVCYGTVHKYLTLGGVRLRGRGGVAAAQSRRMRGLAA